MTEKYLVKLVILKYQENNIMEREILIFIAFLMTLLGVTYPALSIIIRGYKERKLEAEKKHRSHLKGKHV